MNALSEDGVNYIQLQTNVVVSEYTYLNSSRDITIDLAGNILYIARNMRKYDHDVLLTVTNTGADHDGMLVSSPNAYILDGSDFHLNLEKGRFAGRIIISDLTLTVGEGASFEDFLIEYNNKNTPVLSEASDMSNIKLEYKGVSTTVGELDITLPEGIMFYHNGYATEIIMEKEVYTFGAIPAGKITYTFEANGGAGSMAPVEAFGEIILPKCTFTPTEGKNVQGLALQRSRV